MMEQQKLYRNNNLRYSDLAARLGISVSQLSRLMNHEIGMSFNEFVNAYRVQDAKDRLSHNESDEYTLLAVAFDAGFNSKASFNRIFKRHTGLTPSEHVKRHNERAA
ncbi:AraC family transcriptional regulator [candidate division KSB1 bacterium]|nr:AraC family transcriptional regulator [candidate division KSB1 bacterium]